MLTSTLVALALYGNATFYAPFVFTDVWDTQEHKLAPCADCIGYAALMPCDQLGRRIWVSNGHETIGPLHVIDCAKQEHLATRLAKGDVVELPYWLAVRWHMAGRIPVTVYFTAPKELTHGATEITVPDRRTLSAH